MADPTTLPDPRLSAILTRIGDTQPRLMDILHAVQAEFGFVSEGAMRDIALALNVTAAEVHGVVSFYHDFKTAPSGKHVLRLCRAEACKSMGADKLAAEVAGALGITFGETTPDGALTLDEVFCLGLCALAPAGDLDGKQYARLTAPRVALMAGKVRA
ncbi:MAG: NAD(P)H-dependent oxidoreductase subunit E [Deltaproteobacteria bacterium]